MKLLARLTRPTSEHPQLPQAWHPVNDKDPTQQQAHTHRAMAPGSIPALTLPPVLLLQLEYLEPSQSQVVLQ